MIPSLAVRLPMRRARATRSLLSRHIHTTKVECPPKKRNMLITTPIFYVNASPHIGHLHSAVLADALCRYYTLKDPKLINKVTLTTGTDEHGLKVQEAAGNGNTDSIIEFCNAVSHRFRDIFDLANVRYSQFIRTSEERHRSAVQSFWNVLKDKGFIYLGEYEGWYSRSDETFLTDTQVEDRVIPGKETETYKVSKDSGHRVEKIRESNYIFRLSAFQEPLRKWLEENPNVIVPKSRYNEVYAAIQAGLCDISVSRLREKIQWAVAVPHDDDHCVYVWLDALTNYLTCSGYPDAKVMKQTWPADYHIVGKDILKFHAIYWPAFLMAAKLPLPKRIVAHAHWTVDEVKMSKSLGNVVDPFAIVKKYGSDSVRYFLLRDGAIHADGNFSISQLETRVIGELADTLGNLVSRSTSTSFLPNGVISGRSKALTGDDSMLREWGHELVARVSADFELPNFPQGLTRIVHLLHQVNRYFSDKEPWKLGKVLRSQSTSPAEAERVRERLHSILNTTLDAIRLSAILMQPVIPQSAAQILDYLQVPRTERNFSDASFSCDSYLRWRKTQKTLNNASAFVPFLKPMSVKRD